MRSIGARPEYQFSLNYFEKVAKLGKDIFGQFDEELLQPIFSITVKHTDPGKRGEFEKIVMDTLTSLADKGLNEKVVRASVNIKEFELREAEFGGFPKGLVFSLTALSHWMYSEKPIEILEFETPLRTIKENVKYHQDFKITYFQYMQH